ncbi:MAG: tRNA (adenosine(37)-N6)-dimethylallyltransferase MiaA, partial [Candidatus Peribacteraceae bacterium]|nr:tRNA (adenosine(37)-N6)-dimethylallyltransferase MiaA [Candidatus Peribacteraceae bacterium]
KEEVTAAWYKREAEGMIREIQGRGHVPLLVGGSMLYLSAVIDDLQFAGEASPALRRTLGEEYDCDGGAALFRKLQELDPETALSLEPRNKVYLIRALEICMLAGGKASAAKKKSSCPFALFIIGVTRSREELHRRIAERTRQMFASGWVEEVRSLLARGSTTNDPALQSHGYREIARGITEGGGTNLAGLVEIIAAKTRQYAKRQETWWRRDPRIRWITP